MAKLTHGFRGHCPSRHRSPRLQPGAKTLPGVEQKWPKLCCHHFLSEKPASPWRRTAQRKSRTYTTTAFVYIFFFQIIIFQGRETWANIYVGISFFLLLPRVCSNFFFLFTLCQIVSTSLQIIDLTNFVGLRRAFLIVYQKRGE